MFHYKQVCTDPPPWITALMLPAHCGSCQSISGHKQLVLLQYHQIFHLKRLVCNESAAVMLKDSLLGDPGQPAVMVGKKRTVAVAVLSMQGYLSAKSVLHTLTTTA